MSTPTRPGTETTRFELRLAPRPGDGLDWVRAELETPDGASAVTWERQVDEVLLRAVVPPDATATIPVPDPSVPDRSVGSGSTDLLDASPDGTGIPLVSAAPPQAVDATHPWRAPEPVRWHGCERTRTSSEQPMEARTALRRR